MRTLFLSTLLLFTSAFVFAQSASRTLCLFDMQQRNNETNDARIFSANHIVNVAGVSSLVTSDFTEAMKYGIILFSSELKSTSFTSSEIEALTDYVSNGGIVIASRIDHEAYYTLFGIENAEESKKRYLLNFETEEDEVLFNLVDQEFEKSISLGRSNGQDIFKTIAYETTSAESLAQYDDGTTGFIRNVYGQGRAYAFGFSWKDVILRNQINRDYEAQRITSNGFEATQDVLFFILRNIVAKHIPFTVWKHTSPRNTSSTFIVTHDLDSSTGMDSMHIFASDEKERGIVATYNITTRYFHDHIMSAFYSGHKDAVDYLLSYGHAVGSHSVGHFFDFGEEDTFPIGSPGRTQENYSPYNDGTITTGGTVFAECEVSKNILEKNHGYPIRCFRAGHLAFNKYLINVLDSLGYEFDSNVSASDVLTNFPFQSKYGRSFSGLTSAILEIPLTISDVFHNDPITASNYQEKVEIWKTIFDQNDANGAVTTLLIHPNRLWKNTAQSMLLDQLPNSVNIMEMSAFGDFWNLRKDFDFSSFMSDDNLYIGLNEVYREENGILSFIVKDGQDAEEIHVLDKYGLSLYYNLENWKDNDVIVYIEGSLPNSIDYSQATNSEILVYPNPVDNLLFFDLGENGQSDLQIRILDVQGKVIRDFGDENLIEGKQIRVPVHGIHPAIYFLDIQLNGENKQVKFMKI